MAKYKYKVGTKTFRFCCDASEYSFQLCTPYREGREDTVRIKQYNDHSYGVWHTENECWVVLFMVEYLKDGG